MCSFCCLFVISPFLDFVRKMKLFIRLFKNYAISLDTSPSWSKRRKEWATRWMWRSIGLVWEWSRNSCNWRTKKEGELHILYWTLPYLLRHLSCIILVSRIPEMAISTMITPTATAARLLYCPTKVLDVQFVQRIFLHNLQSSCCWIVGLNLPIKIILHAQIFRSWILSYAIWTVRPRLHLCRLVFQCPCLSDIQKRRCNKWAIWSVLCASQSVHDL